jgi:hypothetical protein
MREEAMMLMFLLLVLSMVGSRGQSDPAPPTVIVQVVDVGWLPLPGMTVYMARVNNCRARKKSASPIAQETNLNGQAHFRVEDNAVYVVTLKEAGNFVADPVCVQLFKHHKDRPTAHVQLRARVKVRTTVGSRH